MEIESLYSFLMHHGSVTRRLMSRMDLRSRERKPRARSSVEFGL